MILLSKFALFTKMGLLNLKINLPSPGGEFFRKKGEKVYDFRGGGELLSNGGPEGISILAIPRGHLILSGT